MRLVLATTTLSALVALASAGLGKAPHRRHLERRAVAPRLIANTSYGDLNSGNLNRDSCSSSAWANNMARASPSCVPTI